MNNIKLYKEQKHTLYEIQKEIGVAKDTLYRYARGYRKIEKMAPKMLIAIAYFEKIEPNKLYEAMIEYQNRR